jgi:hypothetical protein
MLMAGKILFIGGSLNQTTMMHKIALHLPEVDCFFTPFYGDGLLESMSRQGWMDFSIFGGRHRRNTEEYLARHALPVDYAGRRHAYDAVVTGTDLVVQQNVRGKKVVLVQEGITVPEGPAYRLVRSLGLPRYLANTAATGLSNAYDVFCVASPGYRDLFARKGVRPEKMAVTGIPNFDNVAACQENDFPYRHYVLAATSNTRETFGWEDRPEFIRKARRIAGGRLLIFKLHPNENRRRARAEIRRFAPEALVYADGDINPMIANCEALVTQYSSVVFVGLAMGKEVYSAMDINLLKKLTPIQNGGTSAERIAEICLDVLHRRPAPQRAAAGRRLVWPGWQVRPPDRA